MLLKPDNRKHLSLQFNLLQSYQQIRIFTEQKLSLWFFSCIYTHFLKKHSVKINSSDFSQIHISYKNPCF